MIVRLVVIALTAMVVHAEAQPIDTTDGEDAVALYDGGKAHFDLAEYTQAITKWKASYRISKEPLLLFNIAQAYRLSGNCAEANRFYLIYKKLVDKPANADELAAAMAKCAGIEPATGESELGPEPVVEPPKPPPPPSKPTPPPRRNVYADQGKTLRLAGLGVGAAGVVAGGLAVVFAASARSNANEVADTPGGTVFDDDLARAERDGRAAQTRSRVFAVVGVAAIATGGALWWIGRGRANVRVDVAIAAQHSEVALTCAF